MIPYIDFHTHKQDIPDSNIIQVINLFPNGYSGQPYCSMGVHPWYIKEINIESDFKVIRDNIELKNILSIGECGLDKICDVDYELQKKVFDAQIQIAEEFFVPIVIHCVKSYRELLEQKRKSASGIDWIIHGFKGSVELAKQLMNEEFYFSVSPTEKWSVKQINGLKIIPLEKLFLETDDSDVSIKIIYQNYSNLTETPIEQLKEQILNNFNKILGRK